MLNAQAISTITPQVESLNNEVKAIPTLQFKVDGLEASTSQISLNEKAISDLGLTTQRNLADLKTEMGTTAASLKSLVSEAEASSKQQFEHTGKTVEILSQKIAKEADELQEVSKQFSSVETLVGQKFQEHSQRVDTLQADANEHQKTLSQEIQSVSGSLRDEITRKMSESEKETQKQLENLSSELQKRADAIEDLQQKQQLQRNYLDNEVIKNFEEKVSSIKAEVDATKEQISTSRIEWSDKVQNIVESVEQIDQKLAQVSTEVHTSETANQAARNREAERLESLEKITQSLENSLGSMDSSIVNDVKRISLQIEQMQNEIKALTNNSEEVCLLGSVLNHF